MKDQIAARRFRFVSFESDGIAIHANPAWFIEGEISGVKDDAFKIRLTYDRDLSALIMKVAIRPAELNAVEKE